MKPHKTLAFFTTKFDELLKEISAANWKASLLKCSKEYQIKCYKIQWLSPSKVKDIYEGIAQRYYMDENAPEDCWHENQLRVYIWTLLTWSEALRTTPDHFDQKHWNRLSEILNYKSVKLLQFQFQNLKCVRVRTEKWNQEEDEVLRGILKKWDNQKISWNEVSKEMYYSTSQKIFRPPKQCRERWNNYLDPAKSHGEWAIDEDRKLIDSVVKLGKRWATIGKQLGDKRTEHMVKNRYNSLLSKFKKEHPSLKQANQSNLIRHINKQLNGSQSAQSSVEMQSPKKPQTEQMHIEPTQPHKQAKQQKNTKEQQKITPATSNIHPPTTNTSFRKNTSRMSEDNMFGSPRIVVTPGYNTGFYPSLTPFLISPSVGGTNNPMWAAGNQSSDYNRFGYENFNNPEGH